MIARGGSLRTPQNLYSFTLLSSQAWLLTLELDRHMTRHRQKDEEAGAEGCGILNTRKVLCLGTKIAKMNC
jgi:hypothetical protein